MIIGFNETPEGGGATPEMSERERLREEAAENVAESFQEALERILDENRTYTANGVEREASDEVCDQVAKRAKAEYDAALAAAKEVELMVGDEEVKKHEQGEPVNSEVYYQQKEAEFLVKLVEDKKRFAQTVAAAEHNHKALADKIREDISGYEAIVAREEAIKPKE